MSRRQYLIILALSIPFAVTSGVRGVVQELFGTQGTVVSPKSAVVLNPSAVAASLPESLPKTIQTSVVNRVELLSDQQLTDAERGRRSDGFPDAELIDQHGRSHRFRSELIRDRIVCVLFFYAECRGTCPGTIEAVKRLRDRLNRECPQIDVQWVALTLDPEKDTSEVLRKYAESRGITPDDGMSEWLFCTGKSGDLELVRRSLGLYDLDPEVDADRTQHAALITIGNDRFDRWTAQPSGITDEDLFETFLRIAGNSERQRFMTRITRSHEVMQTGRNANVIYSGRAETLKCGGTGCCQNPSEYCSLRDSER